ncbi:Protoheme IX farnesyltransferase [Buchnera aphidicola (Phyllaphis fagi)]
MKHYFKLIKPGIIIANLISVTGGFFFASYNYININMLFYTLLGTALVIASGCLFNNIIDIDIDKKMVRTKNRILLQSLHFILYIKILGIFFLLLGCSILFLKVNILSSLLSVIGFLIYVGMYSLYMKRRTMYSTIIGSLSGSIPPLIGYCSVSHIIDFKSILLFIIFSLWQIPHSYSILIFYIEDYKRSKIPVVSIKKGILKTIIDIIFYIFLFFMFIILLYIFKYISLIFMMILSVLNIFWLCISCLCYLFYKHSCYFRLLFYWSIFVIFTLNFMFILNFFKYI